jgi:hypothetical protein
VCLRSRSFTPKLSDDFDLTYDVSIELC